MIKLETLVVEQGGVRLGDFIREHRSLILETWERAIRGLPYAQDLSRPQLLDHLPELLERLAHVVETGRAGEHRTLEMVPEVHALERLDSGYDLEEVTEEYALLRACILQLYGEHAQAAGADCIAEAMGEVVRFNRTFDEAVAAAVSRYARARERTLVALDRISEAVLGTEDLDTFLPKLLRVMLETTEAVDSVSLLLREGNLLRVRASVGLEEGVDTGFTLQVGEGFSGKIALEGHPVEVRSAATDPLVRNPALKTRGTRALYGVPLVHAGEVIGVAHMGSRTAFEFSKEDKLLFRAMVSRATGLIVQAQLVARLRRQEERMRRTAEFRERFLGVVSHDLRNPLNAILLSANALLRAEGLPAGHVKRVRRIATSGERMVRMIGELLDFTRGRLGGGIPIHARPTNLRHLCRQVLEELEIGHPGRELRLVAEGHLQGTWDPDRLVQLLGNLGKNALDYSPQDTPVDFSLHGEGDTVRLEVHNEGPPIPSELLPDIFEPFRRAVEGDGQPTPGLGLGLYIVQQIAQAHGGTVEVCSRAGEGTTFRVRLPRYSGSASVSTDRTAPDS
jgi:signal transduction histidine kinase